MNIKEALKTRINNVLAVRGNIDNVLVYDILESLLETSHVARNRELSRALEQAQLLTLDGD